MKNSRFIYNVVAVLVVGILFVASSCNKTMAQVPYKASIGGMPLYASTALGPSFKAFFTDNVAFQTDIFFKGIFTAGIDTKSNEISFALYISAETNINFYYPKKLKEKNSFDLFWLTGGGISLGHQSGFGFIGGGKFGINAILGMEYVFKNKPLAIQIDFRPGYGLLFNSNNDYVETLFYTYKNPWHHYDWLMGCTLRYTFKEK